MGVGKCERECRQTEGGRDIMATQGARSRRRVLAAYVNTLMHVSRHTRAKEKKHTRETKKKKKEKGKTLAMDRPACLRQPFVGKFSENMKCRSCFHCALLSLYEEKFNES